MISLAPGTKVFLACQLVDLRNYVVRTVMRSRSDLCQDSFDFSSI
jgi:hypothetical protein